MQRKYNVFLLLPMLFLLWSCVDSPLNIQVRFDEVMGLTIGDSVLFKENLIGKVEKVSSPQQGDFLVDLSITPEFKNAATVDSRFFIDDDTKNQQKKAVVIVQEKPGGKVLEKGAIVQGSARTGFLDDMLSGIKRSATAVQSGMQTAIQQMEKSLKVTSQKLDSEMSTTLDELNRQLNILHDEAQKVPDKEEVKQLEKSIKQFGDEFSKAQQSVRDNIRDGLIPQLQKELDHLRQQLHKEGRDEEIYEIDQQINEMNRA